MKLLSYVYLDVNNKCNEFELKVFHLKVWILISGETSGRRVTPGYDRIKMSSFKSWPFELSSSFSWTVSPPVVQKNTKEMERYAIYLSIRRGGIQREGKEIYTFIPSG